MIEFAWPYALILLPLPFVIGYLLPSSFLKEDDKSLGSSLKVPDINDFKTMEHVNSLKSGSKFSLFYLITIACWLSFLLAATRPQWVGKPFEITRSGRDLMLAVDLSGSMMTQDFEINGQRVDRLSALKLILGDFIDRRVGDRIGLILFGSEAYLQTPLTFDRATVKQLLLESAVGLAGSETAIGDAIGLAVKKLQSSPDTNRTLILLTDGKNNTGEILPEKAATLAKNIDLKIHTVAIGTNGSMRKNMGHQQRATLSQDIDEEVLKKISEMTNGHYFRAYDTKELAKIYQQIDEIEAVDKESSLLRSIDEIYYIPLTIALILFCLLIYRRTTS